jgi:short-subunit dehydrogenase
MPRFRELRGSRILLTGASSGIGAALASRLAEQGARLVVTGRRQERLESLVARIRQDGRGEALPVVADLADGAQRTRLLEQTLASLGGLDVLINNAGVGALGWFADASEERMRLLFEVNFFAATELTRLALPHLKQGRDALLVNVSSILGLRGIPGCSEYCASKFALTGWSESLRTELKPHGVALLLVCPGAIETEFRDNLVENRLGYPGRDKRRMSADRCAVQIVRAIKKRQCRLVVTTQAKLLDWLNRLLPGMVDWVMDRFARRTNV